MQEDLVVPSDNQRAMFPWSSGQLSCSTTNPLAMSGPQGLCKTQTNIKILWVYTVGKYLNNNLRKKRKWQWIDRKKLVSHKRKYVHYGDFVVVYETEQWLIIMNVRFTCLTLTLKQADTCLTTYVQYVGGFKRWMWTFCGTCHCEFPFVICPLSWWSFVFPCHKLSCCIMLHDNYNPHYLLLPEGFFLRLFVSPDSDSCKIKQSFD